MLLSICQEFSDVPAGRNRSDGEFSGERFRDDILVPALKEAQETNQKLEVDLNGAEGYGSSFLEEVFGGLVREHKYSPESLRGVLEIKADGGYEVYKRIAEHYIERAHSA